MRPRSSSDTMARLQERIPKGDLGLGGCRSEGNQMYPLVSNVASWEIPKKSRFWGKIIELNGGFSIAMFFPPHLCVGFLFLVVHSRLPPPAPPAACLTHNLLTHNYLSSYSHTTCPHTTCSHTTYTQLTHTQLVHTHTQLCHTQLFHTQLYATLPQRFFYTQLCHTQSFAHNFDTRTQSFTHSFVTNNFVIHNSFTHTQLCHRQCFAHNSFTNNLSHTQLFHSQPFTHNSFTHNFVTHTHTTLHIQLLK